jgi:uroporphyrinogen decarboxylase
MTNRERSLAVLRYESYDRLPVVHFGFWGGKTLVRWAEQGHLPMDLARAWSDGNLADYEITERLGFDFNWYNTFHPYTLLRPGFEREVVAELDDGARHVRNSVGVVLLERPEAGSIPAEIEHTLVDRASYEEHYRHRLQWSEERVTRASVCVNGRTARWDEGGLEMLRSEDRDWPLGLHAGSLFGQIRNIIGLVGVSYMQVDDPELFTEIVDTVADLSYRTTEFVLSHGVRFDFGHFWEDICFKNGPLISPKVFDEKIGPHYRRITGLMSRHGIDIVSLDCDGLIDALIPTWFENGVNTMFPIEVGTWGASIAPWRERYGRGLLGVGGMDKRVLAQDRAAVDAEVERLKPLVDLGGFLPCPDHRIQADAEFELVCYYAERMRAAFG